MAGLVLLTTACKDDPVAVTGVTLDKTEITLLLGSNVLGEYQLIHTVHPSNADWKLVTFLSSAPSAVSVTYNGVIKALRLTEGNPVTITVRTVDGDHMATCTVNVELNPVPLESISLPPTEEVEVDAKIKLPTTLIPYNATINPTLVWSADPAGLVAIDQATGEITGKAVGTTTITVSVKDLSGNTRTGTCALTVKPAGVLNQPEPTWYTQTKFTWKAGYGVDSIAIKKGEEIVYGAVLSEAALAARSLVVNVLAPNTEYMVSIYLEDAIYNTLTFKTPAVPADGNIAVPAGMDFSFLVSNFAVDGWTLNLAAGEEYTLQRLRFSKSITIKAAASARPKVRITAASRISRNAANAQGRIEYITFEKIDFIAETGVDFASIEDFRSAPAKVGSLNVGKISINDCTFENFRRGIQFVESPVSVDNDDVFEELIVENTWVKSLVSNQFFRAGSSVLSTKIGKITIKNSTFSNCPEGIAQLRQPAGFAPDFTAENCTFYNQGAAQIVHNTNGTNINFSKCLFTKGVGAGPHRVVNTVASAILTASGNYRTTDFVPVATTTVDIRDIVELTVDATGLFVDPDNGDFNFKSGQTVNAGDPTKKR